MIETIRTTNLKLVPFSEEHISQDIVDWLNDPEIMRYSDNRHHRHSVEASRGYLKSFEESPNFYWAIIKRCSPQNLIGSITAYIDVNNPVADIGILIGDKTFWGEGYGGEAFSGVIDWLIRVQRIRKITAGTMASNKGVLAVMRKSGMIEEARKRRHYLLDGKEVDMVCGAIFADEWRE